MPNKITIMFFICISIANGQNQESKLLDSIQNLDQVFINTKVIFGSKYIAKNRSGSAYYLSSKDLEKFYYTDVNRLLRTVPGVSIYEEDDFGLRPNISMRGTSPERSAKISIMEDGVLIAPAPYSAPAAYYFPSIARMSAVEILKGSSQIQYGPFTTGGAINMVSSSIPSTLSGSLRSSFGSDEDLWGEVETGDQLPYIAKHQFNVSISLEHNNFELHFNGCQNGAFRTDAGTNTITATNGIRSNFILDFSGKYHFNKQLSFKGTVINLLDRTYAVSKVPAGLRPGHPFGIYGGIEFRF